MPTISCLSSPYHLVCHSWTAGRTAGGSGTVHSVCDLSSTKSATAAAGAQGREGAATSRGGPGDRLAGAHLHSLGRKRAVEPTHQSGAHLSGSTDFVPRTRRYKSRRGWRAGAFFGRVYLPHWHTARSTFRNSPVLFSTFFLSRRPSAAPPALSSSCETPVPFAAHYRYTREV